MTNNSRNKLKNNPNMVKILYIITQQEFGGAQRNIFDLATNLDKSQYDVHIAAGGLDGPLFERARSQNLAVHGLKHLKRSISPLSDFLAYFELKKLIIDVKPDIVHVHSSKAGVLGSMAARTLNVPKIIYTAHGFVFNEPLNPITRQLYTIAERQTAKRVNTVIAVSDFDRQSGIKAGIDESKIITIHNGIDLASLKFLPKEDARLSLRRGVDAPGGLDAYEDMRPRPQGGSRPLIGCVANFYPTKGVDVLVQAMKDVDAQFVMIGDGMLRGQLESLIKKFGLAGRVTLAGHGPHASQYHKAFDL
ncbi:MAG: glycosyltransferase, partial [Patescibacteria group bacterium]|nr:glycosyltransferase [Patescibacteria group bacterium]